MNNTELCNALIKNIPGFDDYAAWNAAQEEWMQLSAEERLNLTEKASAFAGRAKRALPEIFQEGGIDG